jgi:hypothetical protein
MEQKNIPFLKEEMVALNPLFDLNNKKLVAQV